MNTRPAILLASTLAFLAATLAQPALADSPLDKGQTTTTSKSKAGSTGQGKTKQADTSGTSKTPVSKTTKPGDDKNAK